ncbi:hypothetical protein HK104_002669, partial [Borealophlyctis nickersoniae]
MTKLGPILQIKVKSANGDTTRTIVIPKSFTFYNLHRVIQMCLQPTVTEATISKMTAQFKQNGTPAKRGKTIKIDMFKLDEGDSFAYQAGDDEYTCEIETSIKKGETQNFIPRCIAGSKNINAINKVLIFKRFSMNQTHNAKPRQAPATLVATGDPDATLWKTYYNMMSQPAREDEDEMEALLGDLPPSLRKGPAAAAEESSAGAQATGVEGAAETAGTDAGKGVEG